MFFNTFQVVYSQNNNNNNNNNDDDDDDDMLPDKLLVHPCQ